MTLPPVFKPLLKEPNFWSADARFIRWFASPPVPEQNLTTPFFQLFSLLQEAAAETQFRYRHIAPSAVEARAVAVQLDRVASVITELVPQLLSAIDELSTRVPYNDTFLLNLNGLDMRNLTVECAKWQAAAAAEASLWRKRKKPQSVPANPMVVMDWPNQLKVIADQMEELPTRLRMLFMHIRTVNDPQLYAEVQFWLLYQTMQMRVVMVPVPLALSYLGPTCAIWASDLRSLHHTAADSAVLLPNYE